jgi:AcrR family transcriptional regulator
MMKDTKETILKTAYNMFLYNNYEAVTINSIIKATGLTKGAIYHYFVSKEELFKAVVDKYMLEHRIDNLGEFTSLKEFIQFNIDFAKDRIKALVVNNPDFHDDMPINYLSLTVAAFRYYPNYKEIGNKYIEDQGTKWESVIKAAVNKNEILSDIDVEATAALFINIGFGLSRNVFKGDLPTSLELFERQYWTLYNHIKR